MISEDRWQKFRQVVSQRTRYVTLVLEDIFQAHNASAVIRSCELMGVQDLHIIENRNNYEISRDIVVGSHKWVNLHKHNKWVDNTKGCFKHLRKQGYRIVATSPHKNDCLLSELPLDNKTALVFGNEGGGLSDTALENVDAFVKIPMYGLTESYNLSVSAAICMYELIHRMKKEEQNWQLSQEEQDILLFNYALNSIRNPITFMRRMKAELSTR